MSDDRRNAATYTAIAQRSARSEPQGWLRTIAAVIASSGSVAGAARDLGVPRRTLRRWLTGESKPPEARRIQVEQAATTLTRRARLTPAREVRLRKAEVVVVECRYRYDPVDAWRKVKFRLGGDGSTGMRAGTVQSLVDAFLLGAGGTDQGPSTSGLFDRLIVGMTDDWYRDTFWSAAVDHGFDVRKVTLK